MPAAKYLSEDQALDRAYEAGKRNAQIALHEWDDDHPGGVTDEMRTPGVHHCPFTNHPETAALRRRWLEGLADGLERPEAYDPATIRRSIREELKVTDDVR